MVRGTKETKKCRTVLPAQIWVIIVGDEKSFVILGWSRHLFGQDDNSDPASRFRFCEFGAALPVCYSSLQREEGGNTGSGSDCCGFLI